MIKQVVAAGATALVLCLSGCTSTLAPSYTSTNTDLLRIGGSEPATEEPRLENLGTYCLQVTDQWKQDGKTPDGQPIWSKDTYRKATPCQ